MEMPAGVEIGDIEVYLVPFLWNGAASVVDVSSSKGLRRKREREKEREKEKETERERKWGQGEERFKA